MFSYLLAFPVAVMMFGSAALAEDGKICADEACFLDAVRSCETASFEPAQALGARAIYHTIGKVNGACQVDFVFIDNPNPDLIDKHLSMLLDPDTISESVLLERVQSCLAGDAGADYHCSGPLAELATVPGSDDKREAGSLPCGRNANLAEGPPLYPMPKDGKWGYVDRDGAWQIPPQWEQAQDFHEGRAAVGSKHAWGIIDRDGGFVVEMEYESPSTVTTGDERRVSSPFTPYSGGCTVAGIFTDSRQPPFFIDHEGEEHWRHGYPPALEARDILRFGGFSEGLSWFEQRDDESFDNRFGWIDPDGNIVIEADFVSGGNFAGGLAPASSREGQAGFISREGELKLPRKWTLNQAAAFSEGLARARTGPFNVVFLNQERVVFDHVTDQDAPISKKIDAAGDFHDGLAPVSIYTEEEHQEFAYVTPEGELAFVPDRLDGITICTTQPLPEYHNGLVRLIVADDGSSCGEEHYRPGLPEYPDAHYVYLDTAGEVLLRQEKH